jgi:transposase
MDTPNTAAVVGIDVAKDSLEIHSRPSGEHFRCATDSNGLRELVRRLKPLAPRIVVMEATGGYEAVIAAALDAAGVPIAIVNPRQVRKFAEGLGLLAKTDTIDAAVIARFAEVAAPVPRPVPDADHVELRALLARRHQLVEMMVAEAQRAASADNSLIRRSHAAITRHLKAEIVRVETAIGKIIEASPLFRAREDLLRGIPGIGPIVARTLIAELPELGSVGRHQVAALAGLAPYSRDSGKWRGKRWIRAGRPRVRAVLYVAAMAAIRGDGPLARFYRRLVDAGKLKSVALVATMRRMLAIANAMIRTGQPWKEEAAAPRA